MPTTQSTGGRLPATRERGSVLIVAVVLGTGIALSLGSFIAITTSSARLSRQAFYANSALNLTEAGLEQALHAQNQDPDTYTGWTVHATGSNSRFRSTSGFDLGQGTRGQINVLIFDITSSSRRIIAEGLAIPSSGPVLRKQIEIRATRRSLFATGLVAKDAVTFSGNKVTVDSWNSDPDNDPATPPIPYSDAVNRDHGSVGSTAVTVTVGNADVWGFVATGGGDPQVGPNGTIASFSSPEGTVDDDRVSRDFKHNFEPVVTPTGVTLNTISTIGQSGATLPMTLPGTGDVSTVDPVDGLAKYYYQLPGIDASGNSSNVLTIGANVVLLPTAGSGATAVSVTGNASIAIDSGSSLAIYTEGDINIAGNGVTNGATTLTDANQPKNFQIYGTNTSPAGQDISISGNGVLSGVGYAPNARLTINGGGSSGHVLGAFVAKTVTITGGNSFHYDESLKNFGGKNPFELGSWRELFGGERIAF